MTWHDRKPISFLGTVPTCKDESGVVERSMKVNGHWVKQNFASCIMLTWVVLMSLIGELAHMQG